MVDKELIKYVFLPWTLFTGVCVLLSYLTIDLREKTEISGLAAARSEYHEKLEQQFNIAISTAISDAHYFSHKKIIAQFFSKKDKDTLSVVKGDFLNFSQYKEKYDQIRLIDSSGKERIRINYKEDGPVVVSDNKLQNKRGRPYFDDIFNLKAGEIYVSALDLNIENNQIEVPYKPVIRVGTPVYDANDKKAGIFILNLRGDFALNSFFNSNQLMIVDSKGRFLRGLTREDDWSISIPGRPDIKKYFPDEYEKIVSTVNGSFTSEKGLFVVRRIYWSEIPEKLNYISAVSFVSDVQLKQAVSFVFKITFVFSTVLSVLVFAFLWNLYKNRRERQKRTEELISSEERLRGLSSKLLTIQEDERKALARDLHDEMGQVVTALKINLGQIQKKDIPENLHVFLKQAANCADQLLLKIREISKQLRPTVIDDIGIKEAITNLSEEYESSFAIHLNFGFKEEQKIKSPKIKTAIYRAVQESLTNIARHAGAKNAEIYLNVIDDIVHLKITDDGSGCEDIYKRSGLGLTGLQERVRLVNGEINIESQNGKGTSVFIKIPLNGGDCD